MTKLLRLVPAVCMAAMVHVTAASQSLSINTSGNPAHASALLDVESTDKGMLVPRMNKIQKAAIAAPATGLLVFQNGPDSIGFHYFNGTVWIWLPGSNSLDTIAWKTAGNAGTNINSHFFGTTDNIPLSFRQNNAWMGRWNRTAGNYLVGDSAGIKITTGINNTGFGAKTLFENTTAYGNVAIGNNALQNNSTGVRNTAVGDSALYTQSYNPGGAYLSDNTAVGNKALFYNQPTTSGNGGKNVAVGNEAMYLNTTGDQNTAVGVSALRENTTGTGNTAVGRSAHRLSKSGDQNSYFGYASGYFDSTGSLNTGLGGFALNNNQSGDRNTAVGYAALRSDSSGSYNTSIGAYAVFYADTADYTTSVGYAALHYNQRDHNTALGAYAGFQNSRSSTNLSEGIENTMIGYAALTGNAFGSQNTVIGYKAMSIFEPNGSYSGTAPSRNVAIGDSALHANRGNDNVGIGYRALSNTNNINMNGHVAVGSRALINTTATYPNTAIGYSSQDSATTGIANTSVGSYSLTRNKTGFNNTAIGNAAMYEAEGTGTNLTENTAVGNDALRLARYYGNTAIGANALRNDTSGILNVVVGYYGMFNNRSGRGNVAMGYRSLYTNESGYYNTAVGNDALLRHKRPGSSYNTGIGASALEQDSIGFQNTGVGTSVFRNNVEGFYNTGMGINAGYHQKESYNTFVGAYAGVGERAPLSNYAVDTGVGNSGFGTQALYRIANGNYNVAMGIQSMYSDSSGSFNTAAGYNSLFNNTTGSNNVSYGSGALDQNVTGSNNVAIGSDANVGGSNLTNATAIGTHAIVSQSNSMVLGSISGLNGATATTSVAIGITSPSARLHVRRNGLSGGPYNASASMIIEDNASSYLQFTNPSGNETGILSGNAVTTIRSAIIFRADSSLYLRSGGNTTRIAIDNTGFVGIGNTAPADLLHVGTGTGATVRIGSGETIEDFGAFTLGTNSNFYPIVDNNRSLGASLYRWSAVYAAGGVITTSDNRDKENISNLNYGLKEIMKLRPVSYTWKENPQWGKKIGFIAQEVQPVLGEVVQVGDLISKAGTTEEDGKDVKPASDKLGIYYSDIIPVTVKAIQEQQQTIETQNKQIEELEKKNRQLEMDMQLIKSKLGIKN